MAPSDTSIRRSGRPSVEGSRNWMSCWVMKLDLASSADIPLEQAADAGSAGDLFSHVAGGTPWMPTSIGHRDGFWQLVDNLPARDVCDSLVRFYFEGYHPIAGMFHISWFERKYAEFWDVTFQRLGDEADLAETSHFLSLLLATLFTGSVVAAGLRPDDPRSVPNVPHVRDHLHRQGVRSLRLSGFPRAATLDTLSAYILLQVTEMRPEDPFSCVAFIGVAVRVATILGLHRDPKHFFPFIEPVEAERRRRVWWHLAHVDVLIAVATGIPPLIDPSTTDVRSLSEVREMYHGTGTQARYDRLRTQGHAYAEESRQVICTMGVFIAGKVLASSHLRKTLAMIAQGPLSIAANAEALQRDVETLKPELSLKADAIAIPFEPLMTNTFDYEDNEDLRQWSTVLLSILLDHHFSVIGASILRSASETTWPVFRELCLQHCQSYLLRLAKITHTDSFRKFHWAWPGNHSPLHAVMLLLSDIDEEPSTPTAARSRRVLDLVFAFVTGNDGIVPEPTGLRPLSVPGKETWAYLRRARRSAWEKAGWGEPTEWVGGREEAVLECQDLFDSV